MNQIVKRDETATAVTTTTEADMLRVLGNSLYPGAKPESIKLVLAYCRAAGLDPMLKPVHIVPMWDKNSNAMRDVIMPGIGHYRVQASRSGQYLGKSEPEYGPDVTEKVGIIQMTYPAWCKITVKRSIGGYVAEFTATERWLENYATEKRESNNPNTMWRKRPYGQLAKVAEAQALRMAFPELTGGETADEMEGKEMLDVTPAVAPEPLPKTDKKAAAQRKLDNFANVKPTETTPHTIDGEVLPSETEGGAIGVPNMPLKASEAWQTGKWGAGWKWFQTTLPTIEPQHRQFFWGLHTDLLSKVSSYNEEANAAVTALAKENGVKVNVDAAN
jgi:phage recombination protein Bet